MHNSVIPEVNCKRFQGRVAVVTGAGQGIGQATAYRLAKEGAKIAVFDRNEETAAQTSKAIIDFGGMAHPYIVDVANTDQVIETANKVVESYNTVDVLINNAGFDRPGGFLKISAADFQDVWRVHVLGTINCCKALGPSMIEHGYGSIVNVSSIYGRVGSKGESAYSSAKAALIGLTKSLASEWGAKGVRVNAILPGLTNTPAIRDLMHPKVKEAILADTLLGRIAEPSEIAAAIAFLASDDACFVTGAALEVTGGWNL